MKKTDENLKKERKSMYVALALCLVAVGVAALATYFGLSDFLEDNNIDSNSHSQVESKQITNKNDNESSNSKENSQENSGSSTNENSSTSSKSEIDEENHVDEQVNAVPYTIENKFAYPTENKEITTNYSDKELVYNETMKDYRLHNGVDFTADIGNTIYSCNAGLVKDFYNDLLLGNVLVIEHGDYQFKYCGLAKESIVKIGDVVKKGAELGKIDTIPCEKSEGHLHLEVLKNNEYINPMSLAFE